MPASLKVLLSEQETMEALSLGRTLLRRMMAEGRITGTHVGRRLLFHAEEVKRFADEAHKASLTPGACDAV